jgi:hypothetical protein
MLREAGVDIPIMTMVEEEFISSNPVRTGHRRRSPEARARRRTKSNPPLVGGVPRFNHRIGKNACRIRRKTRRSRRVERRKVHRKVQPERPIGPIPGVTALFTAPIRSHTKYWYFLRKKGYYTLSVHHPMG